MRIRRRVNERENLQEYKKGSWTTEEDNILMDYILTHGTGQWNRIDRNTGLQRCGQSCRMRWMNYLSPNVNKGNFTEQEEDLILRLYKLLGNRWSLIAKRIPGRTDTQIKNYCNTHLRKKHVREYSSCQKTSGYGEESPPSLFITNATTSSRHHHQDHNHSNNTAKNFNNVVSAPYNNNPKPNSAENDVVKTNTYEEEFDLSPLVMIDFEF